MNVNKFYIACVLYSVLLGSGFGNMGFGIVTWQYWVFCAPTALAIWVLTYMASALHNDKR